MNLRNDTTLLTVSGGVDSIVMAHLFYTMGFNAAIAHCNFGLRGEESEGDEVFVKELSEKYGFQFFTKKFETKAFASQKSISTQMAARDLRYEWFEEVRQKQNFQWTATAHHANDSFETVLLNLTRGTGLAGLTGITGVNGFLIRPLILTSKAEILEYTHKNGLEWREDRSNDSDDYKRNLLRHNALPVFHQLNPTLESTFKTTSEKLQSANELLNEFLQKWKLDTLKIEGGITRIAIKDLLLISEPLYRLWYLLEEFGFNYTQARQIMNCVNGISGKVFLSPKYKLLINRAELIIKKNVREEIDEELLIHKLEGRFSIGDKLLIFEQKEMKPEPGFIVSAETILLDPKKIVLPLKIRKWKRGDSFQPFGMGGKQKKISDLFTDLKLDLFQKEEVRLLVNGDEAIVWVIGIRFDERHRIEKGTENPITVTVKPESDEKKF